MSECCNICQSPAREYAQSLIRGKYRAHFWQCTSCGFAFVSNPVWLAEAYAEAINMADTGYVARNIFCAGKVRALIEAAMNPDGQFLDYGAGFGMFVRMMRDAGYDFRWFDQYCQNLLSRGFEAPTPLTSSYEAVTAFEVLEHLPNPREEIHRMAALADTLIFSTTLITNPPPQPSDWWYYGLTHGQHVAFYSARSLEVLAGQLGRHVATFDRELHVFSRQPLPADVFNPRPRRKWWQLGKRSRRPAGSWSQKARSPRLSLTEKDCQMIVKMEEQMQRAAASRLEASRTVAASNHGPPAAV